MGRTLQETCLRKERDVTQKRAKSARRDSDKRRRDSEKSVDSLVGEDVLRVESLPLPAYL